MKYRSLARALEKREGARKGETARDSQRHPAINMGVELHTVPGFNKTEGDGYTFQDDGSTAEVRVSIPRGVQELTATCRNAKDFVKIALSENSLKVEVKGLSEPLLSCDELWGSIRPRDTTWTLDRNTNEIVVYLSKVKGKEKGSTPVHQIDSTHTHTHRGREREREGERERR